MSKSRKILLGLGKYVLLTLSCVLYAVAFCWLYLPNGISPGGFTGISQIINFIFPSIPIGLSAIVLNVPLFVMGFKIQGFKVLIESMYCMIMCYIFVDYVGRVYVFEPMSDILLASICGGVLVGIASGIQIRIGATNGGSELTARLLKYKFSHISVGKLCLAIDVAVIISYAVTFQKINNALYGIVSMYILSIAVDFVVYGGTHAKMAYIISDSGEQIRKKLLSMNLGVTLLEGNGGWSEKKKKTILCAFRPQQIAAVKKAVVEIDPDSFVIVCNANEILGEGFHTYSPDDL